MFHAYNYVHTIEANPALLGQQKGDVCYLTKGRRQGAKDQDSAEEDGLFRHRG